MQLSTRAGCTLARMEVIASGMNYVFMSCTTDHAQARIGTCAALCHHVLHYFQPWVYRIAFSCFSGGLASRLCRQPLLIILGHIWQCSTVGG